MVEGKAPSQDAGGLPVRPTVTNCLQARLFGAQHPGLSCAINLEGQVCWFEAERKRFALTDSSGGLILEMNWLTQPLAVGEHLRLNGSATVVKAGNIFRVGPDGVAVDNNGLHPMIEQTQSVFLKAEKIPILLEWFNGGGPFGLDMEYAGPGVPQQMIPNSQLSRTSEKTTTSSLGLDCQVYEGWWHELPNFNELKPVKSGIVSNFNLTLRTRNEGVGLQFSGFFDVPRDGIYKFSLTSDDGSRLVIGWTNLQAMVVSQGKLGPPNQLIIGQIMPEEQDGSWAQLEGRITRIWGEPDGINLELSIGLARMNVKAGKKALWAKPEMLNRLVRATGFCQGAYNTDGLKVPNLLLVPDDSDVELLPSLIQTNDTELGPQKLPFLTTASEVRRLKRQEAEMKYPIKMRGVITGNDPLTRGFTFQDATGGLFVVGASPVKVGDFVEVEGVTDPGLFSPMVRPTRVTPLGEGRLPQPIHPTWDQLLNGSLDAQYVELQGIIISSQNEIRLLTPGGSIAVELVYGVDLEDRRIYENTPVVIRGSLLAYWNADTHQVRAGTIRIASPVMTRINPETDDAFATRSKTPEDLLLFDPGASLFQRVQMSGQIVQLQDDVYYMMVGKSGIRFAAGKTRRFSIGDMVDVVGYPQLGGASPSLRGTLVRKTGHAPLPEARLLPPGQLACAECDSTLVKLEGVLVGVSKSGGNVVLELQQGAENFAAILKEGYNFPQTLPLGARLQLTGVYAVQDANPIAGPPGPGFEILLNSAGDVKILARPPWWTLRRLLIMVATLASILVIAVLWITQLRRKVDERTIQLEEQIRKRQSIEQHRAMEQERARIAQDLHDELGSGLTEISMLAVSTAPVETSPYLSQIADRARHLVTGLDEIVWAMNPKHDSIQSLGTYLCLYADRFLKLASITCRLKGEFALPGQALNPSHRHEFFLAFKEALTNVVRHSGATEVRLSIRIIGDRLRLSLADNGGGLERTDSMAPGKDGLANMRARLEKIGGRFAIASQAGRGTTLRFYLPII